MEAVAVWRGNRSVMVAFQSSKPEEQNRDGGINNFSCSEEDLEKGTLHLRSVCESFMDHACCLLPTSIFYPPLCNYMRWKSKTPAEFSRSAVDSFMPRCGKDVWKQLSALSWSISTSIFSNFHDSL